MRTFVIIVVKALIFATSFWFSIRLIDGSASRYTFGLGLLAGALVSTVGGVFGAIYGIPVIVGAAYLMIRLYQVGIMLTFGVLIICDVFQELGGWVVEAVLQGITTA